MPMKPLLIVPAIPKDDRIKFILPDQEILLDAKITQDAWAILELCNGINSVDIIVERLLGIEKEFIVGFLNDLSSLGTIVDSREVYKHFHAISSNPMVYPSDITEDEIVEHVKSPRMPIREGKAFSYRQETESVLVRLQELRVSCRSFSDERLSIDEIGSVLDAGYSLGRRAVPSAGGLYPMKIFAIALEQQRDFPAGYYEYDSENDHLVLFNETPDPQRVFYAFNDVELPFGAPVVFVIAADANRQPYKYSNRGYRFMAIEAGHIAQNISLAAVELGLATCELGSMLDGVISDELGLSGCLPFVAIAIGKAALAEGLTPSRAADRLERAFLGEEKPVRRLWSVENTFARNFDKSYFQCLALTGNHQVVSGISTCWADAKVKAIAEGYERQRASVVRWDVRSSATNLRGEWVDPRVITPLTDEQYGELPYLQKFDEALEIEWVQGVDHVGRSVFVPIDLVFYPHAVIGRKPIVDTCSSGFAAFTDYEGAVNRGILELIERDALMQSWYEKASPRILDFAILPVHLQNRVRYWEDRARNIFVLDLSRRGVIVIQVVITSDEFPCFVSGASSSLNGFEEVAIKAFYEAESRLIYGLNEPSGGNIMPHEVHSVLDHELLYAQSREYQGHVAFLFAGALSETAPVASASFSDLKEELEVVTVDASEDGSSLSVVKVLSPKLVPISFGYGAGHHAHHSLSSVDESSTIVPHYFA